jgi:hypothetical protein
MRRVPSSNPNTTVHREADRPAFKRLLLVLLISLVCAGGFVMAARQHVWAIKLGYETQALRREREKLKTDQDQMRNARQAALSPARLSAEAQKLGLQLATVKQIDSEPAQAGKGNGPVADDDSPKPPGKKPAAKKPEPKRPDGKPSGRAKH